MDKRRRDCIDDFHSRKYYAEDMVGIDKKSAGYSHLGSGSFGMASVGPKVQRKMTRQETTRRGMVPFGEEGDNTPPLGESTSKPRILALVGS